MNKPQKIGIVVIIVTLLVLGLLFFLKIKTDRGMLKACQDSCGKEEGTGSCTLASCPYHQDTGSSWIIWGAALLLAFLAGVGAYLVLPQKSETSIYEKNREGKETNEKEPDISLLNEAEKNIFTRIRNNVEGVYQRQLAQEFQLSKVQTTRLLHKLEGMDLIERKRKGFTNLVKVKYQ